jgi:ABC-type transport system substrate-binding protein
LLALALLSAACQSGSSGGKAGQGAVYSGPPRKGGVMTIGLAGVRSLDPAQANSPEELLLADQLFDGVTTYDPNNEDPRPAVASSWTATPDQQHWDFTLRPDARFANGRTIGSADVKYTLERIAAKDSTSPVAVQLEVVSGYRPFHDEGKAGGLSGVTTPAPDKVHLDLDQPFSSLPAVLGNPAFGIVPREAVEAPGFADRPVGSGPFMISARTGPDLRLVPSPGATTYVDGLNVRLEHDQASAYASFRGGRLDWTLVPADRVEEVSTRPQAGAQPYLADLFYGFNLKNPKYGDVRFREAIVHAVDRDAIVKVIYGGTAKAASDVVAEGVPGHQPDVCGDRCRHDPARARALLAEAFGTKPVPRIAIDYDQDATQEAIAKAMQANLAEVGITADVRPHSYIDYLSFARSGQQELFRLGWIGAYPAVDAFLNPLFTTGLPDNLVGFSSPEVDNLLKAGRAEPDPAKRLDLYQQADRLVMGQLPVVPIAQFLTHSVASTRVRDLVVNSLGTFDASRVWLTPGPSPKRRG